MGTTTTSNRQARVVPRQIYQSRTKAFVRLGAAMVGWRGGQQETRNLNCSIKVWTITNTRMEVAERRQQVSKTASRYSPSRWLHRHISFNQLGLILSIIKQAWHQWVHQLRRARGSLKTKWQIASNRRSQRGSKSLPSTRATATCSESLSTRSCFPTVAILRAIKVQISHHWRLRKLLAISF